MKYEEAHDILVSKGVIEVLYQGQPIWIKGLNPNGDTAEIKSLDGTFEHREVPLKDLDALI